METLNIAVCGDHSGKSTIISSFLKYFIKDSTPSISEKIESHSFLYNHKKLFYITIYENDGSSFNCFETIKKCDAFIILFSQEDNMCIENISIYLDIIGCNFNKIDIPILLVELNSHQKKIKKSNISKKEIEKFNVPLLKVNESDLKSSIKITNSLIDQVLKKESQMKKELNHFKNSNNIFNKFKCFKSN